MKRFKKMFHTELKCLLDEPNEPDVAKLIHAVLLRVAPAIPDKFYLMPASSTGKYHPVTSSGAGGLIVHTKAVFWIAVSILETSVIDVKHPSAVLGATLLHDAWKYNDNKSGFTVRNHAILAVDIIVETLNDSALELNRDIETMLRCVKHHNGRFTKEWDGRPMTAEEQVVHVADYLASRKFLPLSILNLPKERRKD